MELKQLGKYKILARIGRGAMGEVYRAYDPVLNREVAIKTMSSEIGADEELRKRFEREAQSAARLNHPNVITVYDYGEEQGQVYIAMELLEGIDLKELIVKKTALNLEEKLSLMEQMAEGLAFAHAKGVVHRDLKPANIHVQRGGQVKIMDFGLARFSTSDMTRAGAILGTPNYMSPEQVRGEKATAQSDIFSLGAVFYELLTYRKAFVGETLHGVLFQVVGQDPEPLAQIVPGVPAALSQVIEKALAKDTGLRFRDARELREGLRSVRAALATAASAAASAASTDREAPIFSADSATLAATLGPTLTRAAGGAGPEPTAVPASAPVGETVLAERRPRSTVVPAPRVHPSISRPPPGRSTSLWLGITAGATLVVLAGVYWFYRSRPVEAPSVTTSAPPPLVEVPPSPEPKTDFAAVLDEARRLLDERDYRTAVARAETVLAQDRENREAQEMLERARARLREADGAAADLKRALDASDVDRASQALGRLVDLDPRHPEVPGLTLRLNTAFKGRMDVARQALEKARAQPPPAPVSEADRSAVSGSRAASAGPTPSSPTPAVQEPPSTPAASSPKPQPPPSAPPTPTPTPAVQTPTPAPAPPVAPQTEAQARQAIQGALEAYRAAFESLSADALRAIHPSVDYETMKARFASVTAFDVKMKVQSISLQGETATATCLVTYTPKPKPAGRIPPVPTTFYLKRSGAVWIIDRVARN